MGVLPNILSGDLCANNCGRQADKWFSKDPSAMDITHGFYGDLWCIRCILEEQISYAKKIAFTINTLEDKLEEIKKNE